MSVSVYHGDLPSESLAALEQRLGELRRGGTRIVELDGAALEPAALAAALEQDDFFGGARAVVIRGLFARPKSKRRDALLAQIASVTPDVLLWEGKKLTAAALKPLGKPQLFASHSASAIWQLTAALAPDNSSPEFLTLFERTLAQASAIDPGLYVLATLLWQVQQLLDAKLGNYHGAPFGRARIAAQAGRFTLGQLEALHQRLIDLDYRAKTGRLSLPVSQQLYLALAL